MKQARLTTCGLPGSSGPGFAEARSSGIVRQPAYVADDPADRVTDIEAIMVAKQTSEAPPHSYCGVRSRYKRGDSAQRHGESDWVRPRERSAQDWSRAAQPGRRPQLHGASPAACKGLWRANPEPTQINDRRRSHLWDTSHLSVNNDYVMRR